VEVILDMCGDYATEYCISFNMLLKQSVSWFCRKTGADLRAGFMGCALVINNSPIEFVDSFIHIGHVFTSQWPRNDGLDVLIGVQHSSGRSIICFASLGSYRRMIHLYCSLHCVEKIYTLEFTATHSLLFVAVNLSMPVCFR